MPKRKRPLITVVTGTRAEYGLLKPLLRELLRRRKLAVQLIVTGMHTLSAFGKTLNDIRKDTMPIAAVIPVDPKDDMLASFAKELRGIQNYCRAKCPDALLVLGDRDEAFAAATVGVHEGIPVIHISGGDESGPSVDHQLRNALTVFSALHLTQTRKSTRNVLRLGAPRSHVVTVGSLGLDGLRRSALFSRSTVGQRLRLDPHRPWFFLLHHPTAFSPTPIAEQIDPLLSVARGLDGERIIVYPNSDRGSAYFLRRIRAFAKLPHTVALPNLERPFFLSLLAESAAFIGNSSCGLIEAAHLCTPFVNVGDRQQHREAGENVIAATYSATNIRKAIRQALSPSFRRRLRAETSPYQGGPVAKRAAGAIERFLLAKGT